MHQSRRLILALWASIAAIAAGLNAGAAQEVSAPGGFEFFVTPYLWLASVHATTSTQLAQEPEVNSDVSFIHLLGHLDGAPFMGSFEVRNGDLGFLVDAIHLPASTTIRTHDLLFQGGNAELHVNMGTGVVLWRVLQDRCSLPISAPGFAPGGSSPILGSIPVCFQG